MPEKTKTILWSIGGLLFFLLGVFLLGYTGYIIAQKEESQRISEILPSKDLEFIIFKNISDANTGEKNDFFSKKLSPFFTDLKTGAIAIYPNNVLVQISLHTKQENKPKNKPKNEQEKIDSEIYCEEAKGYDFCTDIQSKERILFLVDSIQKNSPVLADQREFKEAQKNTSFDKDIGIQVFGKTAFAMKIFWTEGKVILSEEMQEGVLNALSLIQEESPYVSGNIHAEEFSFFLSKKQDKTFFAHIISEYDISEYFIHSSADRYFFMKKPKVAWDIVFSSFLEKDMKTEFFTKKILSHSFSTFFTGMSQQGNVSLNFNTDILPLFEGDVLWAENPVGSMIIYSLPKKSISSEVFEKFAHTTEKIAQWSVPVKVGHTLKDGTTVYEVFPNTDNITIEKDEDDNGKKIIFTNTESEKSQKSLGVVQRDTFLMISNEESFLEHFWNLSGEKFAFSPLSEHSKNTFFSLGFSKRENEKTPFEFIEISGEESSEYFKISGKSAWHTLFSKEEVVPEKIEEVLDEGLEEISEE